MPTISHRKLNDAQHSGGPYPTLPPLKPTSPSHPPCSHHDHKHPSPSPQRSGPVPHPDGHSSCGRCLPPPHPPTCRRSLPHLSACQPPGPAACGQPSFTARGAPVLPSGGPLTASPAAAAANPASFPYPCLLSSECLHPAACISAYFLVPCNRLFDFFFKHTREANCSIYFAVCAMFFASCCVVDIGLLTVPLRYCLFSRG